MKPITEVCREVFRTAKAVLAYSSREKISTLAGSLAYTTVLSIVPFFAVFLVLIQMAGFFDFAFARVQPFIVQNLTPGAGSAVEEQLRKFIESLHSRSFGFLGFLGICLSSFLFFVECSNTLNRILSPGIAAPSVFASFVGRNLFRSLFVLIIGPLLAVLSIALTTVVAGYLKYQGHDIIPHLATLLSLVLDIMLFCLLYSMLPRKRFSFKITLQTAALVSILWEITKWGYTVYAKISFSSSSLYGSLAAIPLLLLWIYVSWYIVLLGGCFAHIQKFRVDLKKTPETLHETATNLPPSHP